MTKWQSLSLHNFKVYVQVLQKIHGKQEKEFAEKLQSEQSLLSDCERMKKEKVSLNAYLLFIPL